jgi:hypothetical protein
VRIRRAGALGVIAAALLAGAALTPPAFAATARPALAGGRASGAQGSLQPWPVTITIRTVPPLPGVRLMFDGTSLVTGPGGSASVTDRHNFSAHTLALVHTQIAASGRRYTFARWAGQRDPDQAFRPTVRGLPMRASYTVTASFAVMCRVMPRLTEQDGTALAAARVTRITLRSDLGQPATLRPGALTWLPCAWPVYRDSLLSSRDLRYSVQSMLVSGTNVVRAGFERFEPTLTPQPTVTGFFHTLTITAHDALFGGATGTYALLTMPDHTVRRVPLRAGHAVTVRNLPQGNYRVDVRAGGASVSALTVRLSRDETANLTAVTSADLAVIGGVLAIAVAGLPLLSGARRRRVLAFALRRLRQAGGTA